MKIFVIHKLLSNHQTMPQVYMVKKKKSIQISKFSKYIVNHNALSYRYLTKMK
jgi:hypothetical protein